MFEPTSILYLAFAAFIAWYIIERINDDTDRLR